jgi:hypothetical protein
MQFEWSLLFPTICCGLALLALMVRFPKVWLGILLLGLPLFLTDTGKDISVTETISGGLYTISLFFWLVWRIGSNKPSLIRSWPDFLLVLFVVLAVGNAALAKFNGTALLGWGVDWSYFMLMLYYFPLREEFGADERSFSQFIALCGSSAVLMSVYSAYNFKNRMAENMVYAYQITASRSALLGPIFLLAICVGIAVVFHTNIKGKILTYAFLIINLGALIITFTRTLWVFVFVCLFIIMLFLRVRQNLAIVVSSVTLAATTVVLFYSFNPKLADIAVRLVQKRFASSTQLSGGDHSFETRLIEVNNAWKKVKQYPLGGSGLRARFVTWQPIEGWHNTVAFVHIGYVGLIHKVGFPLALVLFAALIGFTIQSFRNAIALRKRWTSPLKRGVAFGVVAFFPALYVNIFMAGIFDQRYGNIMMAFLFTCVAICGQHVNELRQIDTEIPAA